MPTSDAASPAHPSTSVPAKAAFEPIERLSWREALASARETKALLLGPGVLNRTPEVFRENFAGCSATVVADPNTLAIAGHAVSAALRSSGLESVPPYVFAETKPYAEISFVERLEQAFRTHDAIPVAVGAGTINDLVKLAAHRVGRPYLCVATAASMDGYTAFGASITARGAKQTFQCPAPRAVVADTDVIRRAPRAMTASGYADLQAKITAGADWLVADALGVEPIDHRAWAIVQGGLRDALANPAGAGAGKAEAISALTEGLMLGGFAMQWSKSSRPASGAEHQFSHLWDMEHHDHNGEAPSHGFKVGLATLAVTSLFEHLLRQPLERLDVNRCCANWPEPALIEAQVRREFEGTDFVETAVAETLAKHSSLQELREQLTQLRATWPALRQRLQAQLLPCREIAARLRSAGSPTEPEAIGITRERLRRSFVRAYHIRRRYTVLDLAVRTGTLDASLDALFGPSGIWSPEARTLAPSRS
jgi:glycerol-1-phosphate dehydrogenase [NAD(P)+]